MNDINYTPERSDFGFFFKKNPLNHQGEPVQFWSETEPSISSPPPFLAVGGPGEYDISVRLQSPSNTRPHLKLQILDGLINFLVFWN